MISTQNTHSDYCPHCGALLSFDSPLPQVQCPRCPFIMPIQNFQVHPRLTTFQLQTPQWLVEREHWSSVQNLIEQKCPSCGHDKMFYFTKQVRGADEGSTMFYRCEKCNYTYNQNN